MNKLLKCLPLFSFTNYFNSLQEGTSPDLPKSPNVKKAKLLGHFLYGLIAGSYLLVNGPMYIVNSIKTNELNPFKQSTIIRQIEENEAKKEELYQKLWRDIFGFGSYADLNANSVINFDERVEAFRKMGLIGEYDVPIEGETQLPKPTLNDLEKAVQNYQAERK